METLFCLDRFKKAQAKLKTVTLLQDNQENLISFLSYHLQGEHSVTLGIRVVVPVEVGCCVSLHSRGMSAPAGGPFCGAYQLCNPSTVMLYVRVYVCCLVVNRESICILGDKLRHYKSFKTSVLFSEFSLTKLYPFWRPLQQQSPRSLICHKELMKRTLGRPTYAFEARQYVVSVCDRCQWVPEVCLCFWERGKLYGRNNTWMNREYVRMCVISKSRVGHRQ